MYMCLFIFILYVYLFTQHYHKKYNKSICSHAIALNGGFYWNLFACCCTASEVTIVVTGMVYSSVTWLQAICKLQLYVRKKAKFKLLFSESHPLCHGS